MRRPASGDPRAEMYRSLELVKEILDHDLDTEEHAELEARLRRVARQTEAEPDLARLAQSILDVIASGALAVKPAVPGFIQRIRARANALEARWLSRRRLRAMLIFGLGMFGLVTALELAALALALLIPPEAAQEVLKLFGDAGAGGSTWIFLSLGLDGSIGLLMLSAAALFILGRDWRGFTVGYFSLLISLTTANLLGFYYEQFSAIIGALIQLVLLLGLVHYRRRYLARATGE
jgi:hypothetical protein